MRLTEKNEFGYILHTKSIDNSLGNEIAIVGKTADKLGQLEDIEEELGIDLITLIKCIKSEKGIWKKDLDGNLFNARCMLTCYFGRWQVYDKGIIYDLKDYGKTWALTKEELL